MNDIWVKIVEALTGSSQSLTACLGAHDCLDLQDNADFLEFLDGEIFECSVCGWWCEINEEISVDHDLDELTCSDCVE